MRERKGGRKGGMVQVLERRKNDKEEKRRKRGTRKGENEGIRKNNQVSGELSRTFTYTY